jgi:hypothetical protein
MRRACLVLALAALGFQAIASAHHSFAAYYFEEQSVTVEGPLVEFEFRNPHAWVHVTAPDSADELRKYSAEWSNPNRLSQQGITRNTLKPGEHLVVTGSPGRTPGEYKIHLKRIVRPADGWKWTGGRGERR